MPEMTEQPDVECVPIGDSDMPFLFQVYAATREEEMKQAGWSETEKNAFLHMQFELQHHHYTNYFKGTSFHKIIYRKRAAGRFYVYRGEREIRVVDVALLPAFQNLGIGTTLMERLMAEAEGNGVPVTLHVERWSRARRFYRRLGFEHVSESDTHIQMKWMPADVAASAPHAESRP